MTVVAAILGFIALTNGLCVLWLWGQVRYWRRDGRLQHAQGKDLRRQLNTAEAQLEQRR